MQQHTTAVNADLTLLYLFGEPRTTGLIYEKTIKCDTGNHPNAVLHFPIRNYTLENMVLLTYGVIND